MKIKFQNGGALPPFADYTPIPNAFSNPFETSSDGEPSKKKPDDFGLKDIMELIKDLNGLPNDANVLAVSLKNMIELSQFIGESLDSSDLASMYVKFLSQSNTAKFNKERYDNAFKKVNENGGLNEVAIVGNKLVAQNTETGAILYINPLKINELGDNMLILTNSNLLALRAQNPNMSFLNSILDIVENGIGLETVNKLIHDYINKIGTSTFSLEGYVNNLKGTILNGIQFLKDAYNKAIKSGLLITSGMDVTGLYEAKLLTESQAEQALQALLYIYTMLPENAKTLLIAKTGSINDALKAIFLMLGSTISSKIDWQSKLVKDSNDNKGNESSDKTKLNTAAQFLQGRGYASEAVLTNGTTDGLKIKTTTLPGLGSDKNPTGVNTLKELNKGLFRGLIDWLHMYMGNQRIDPNALDKVIYDGEVKMADMPVNPTNPNRPDFSLLKIKEQADLYIRENKIIDPQEKNKVYELFNLPVKYDTEGKLIIQNWKTFVLLNGHALDTSFTEFDALQNDLDEMTSEREIKNVLNIIYSDSKDKKNITSFDYNDKGIFEFSHDAMFRGTIWAPLLDNIFSAMAGSGEDLSVNTSLNWEVLLQTYDKRQDLLKEIKLQQFPE